MDARAFHAAMRHAPKELHAEMDRRWPAYMRGFVFQKFTKSRLRGRPGLISRSRSLTLSFKVIPKGSGPDLVVRAMTTHRAARTHEYGDPNRTPRRSKYLAIPLRAAKAAAGNVKKPPRQWPNTFVIRSKLKPGTLVIMRKTGRKRPKNLPEGSRDPSIEPLFALKKSVRIPARLGFFDTWKRDRPAQVKTLNNAGKAALVKAFPSG